MFLTLSILNNVSFCNVLDNPFSLICLILCDSLKANFSKSFSSESSVELSQLDSLSIGISPLISPLENSSTMDKFKLEFIVLLATLDFVFEFCFLRSVKLLWKSFEVLLGVPDFDLFIISSVSADEAETFPSWSSEFLDKDSVILFTCFGTSLICLALIELDILFATTAVLSVDFISINILLLRVCNICLLFNLTLADGNCAVPTTQLLSVSFSELKFVFSSAVVSYKIFVPPNGLILGFLFLSDIALFASCCEIEAFNTVVSAEPFLSFLSKPLTVSPLATDISISL